MINLLKTIPTLLPQKTDYYLKIYTRQQSSQYMVNGKFKRWTPICPLSIEGDWEKKDKSKNKNSRKAL